MLVPLYTLLVSIALLATTEPGEKGASMQADSIPAATLLEQADSTFQKRDYQAAFDQYSLTASTARDEFNRPVEVEALSQMARMCLGMDKPEEGRAFLKEAAAKADDQDPLGWSRYLGVKGRFEWRAEDLPSARQTFDQYYTYCAVNNLTARAIDAVNMCAIVAESPEKSIEWSKRGIQMAESYDNESWLGPLWNNLAGTYYDLKQFDSALDCYLKSREYHWRHSAEGAKLVADYHVGMAYRLVGNSAEAKKWLRPVLAWAERLENHSIIAQASDDLGEIARTEGHREEALAYLTRARDEYKLDAYDQHSPEIWQSINERLASLGK